VIQARLEIGNETFLRPFVAGTSRAVYDPAWWMSRTKSCEWACKVASQAAMHPCGVLTVPGAADALDVGLLDNHALQGMPGRQLGRLAKPGSAMRSCSSQAIALQIESPLATRKRQNFPIKHQSAPRLALISLVWALRPRRLSFVERLHLDMSNTMPLSLADSTSPGPIIGLDLPRPWPAMR